MLIDELIEVVEKKQICENQMYSKVCSKDCLHCDYVIMYDKLDECFNDILMRLNQEKWARDKMEEMKVEEVD